MIKTGKFFLIVTLVLAITIGNGVHAKAEEPQSLMLYNKGVKDDIINSKKYDYAKWKASILSLLKSTYDEIGKTYDNNDSFSKWVEDNNYGIIPLTDDSIADSKNTGMLRSTASNMNKFIKTIKAGDIIYTTQYRLSGFIGHAAIANGDGHILEMPGGSNWNKGIKDNNRQVTTKKYFQNHSKDWNYVYRVRNKSLAKKVATYADRHYYSTTGSAKKNIHINYKLDFALKQKNPNYCSKLVYQAYYYGSGSLNVMKPYPAYTTPIPPSQVINTFRDAYLPYNIGKY